MSSNQHSNDVKTANQVPTGDDTSAKSADSHKTPSSGGHEVTGAEKMADIGGSGGVPVRTGQGYEALAHHN